MNIQDKYLSILSQIFRQVCPKVTVLAYGSRVTGDSHQGSDLDLAIKNVTISEIATLKDAIYQSNIPFLVDIHQYESLPDRFKTKIDKECVVIYDVTTD